MRDTASDGLHVATGAEARSFTLSIGELFVLSQLAPSHRTGESFDFLRALKGCGNKPVPLSSEHYVGFADSLCEKGIFERTRGTRYRITDYGEAVWKAVFGESWKKSRQGAGIGWKR